MGTALRVRSMSNRSWIASLSFTRHRPSSAAIWRALSSVSFHGSICTANVLRTTARRTQSYCAFLRSLPSSAGGGGSPRSPPRASRAASCAGVESTSSGSSIDTCSLCRPMASLGVNSGSGSTSVGPSSSSACASVASTPVVAGSCAISSVSTLSVHRSIFHLSSYTPMRWSSLSKQKRAATSWSGVAVPGWNMNHAVPLMDASILWKSNVSLSGSYARMAVPIAAVRVSMMILGGETEVCKK